MSGDLPGHATADTQSIAKKVFQVGDCVNLLDCRIYVVLNATVANRFAIEEDIAGAPIAVARLTNRADIAKGLAPVQVVDVIDFLRAMELQGFGEYTGHMRVALETVLVDECKNALHLPLVVNVFGENVLVQRISCRAVHVKEAVFPKGARPFGQEFPASFARLTILNGTFELGACPQDRALGGRVKALRVKHRPLVVVA